MARLYYDPGRSRLLRDDVWFDMSDYNAEFLAKWCVENGVEFFDNRIDKHPEWLRGPLLRARAIQHGRRKHGAFYFPRRGIAV